MSEREDQVCRLARLLCYYKTGKVEFDGKNPLDDPRWLQEAEANIDYVLNGGTFK